MKERELSKSSIEDRRHVGRRFLASLAIGMCVTSLSSDHLSYAAALGVPDDLFIVALGDSYPSGEGNPPFDGTDLLRQYLSFLRREGYLHLKDTNRQAQR
jgi:hypothetical protein